MIVIGVAVLFGSGAGHSPILRVQMRTISGTKSLIDTSIYLQDRTNPFNRGGF